MITNSTVELFEILYELISCLDDAIAIFVALQSPEIEVIGLTTIFGNVQTTLSTRNALHLVKFYLYFIIGHGV